MVLTEKYTLGFILCFTIENMLFEAQLKKKTVVIIIRGLFLCVIVKVHLSFSLYGSSGDEDKKKPTQLHSNALNLFLQSVGIVLTDIQDVVFK